MSVFRSPSGFANGHARDRQGRLIGCSHQDRCITRVELDGTLTVLASHYRGKRLNSPNDIVCRSDGSIWFSDPPYGINTDYEGGKQTSELPPSLYHLDRATGALTVAADDFDGPNGLAFSPDESLLYVAETGRPVRSRCKPVHPPLQRRRQWPPVRRRSLLQSRSRLCGWVSRR